MISETKTTNKQDKDNEQANMSETRELTSEEEIRKAEHEIELAGIRDRKKKRETLDQEVLDALCEELELINSEDVKILDRYLEKHGDKPNMKEAILSIYYSFLAMHWNGLTKENLTDLISRGLDINKSLLERGGTSAEANIPLHMACERRYDDVIMTLLECGADPALTDCGYNACDWAVTGHSAYQEYDIGDWYSLVKSMIQSGCPPPRKWMLEIRDDMEHIVALYDVLDNIAKSES